MPAKKAAMKVAKGKAQQAKPAMKVDNKKPAAMKKEEPKKAGKAAASMKKEPEKTEVELKLDVLKEALEANYADVHCHDILLKL